MRRQRPQYPKNPTTFRHRSELTLRAKTEQAPDRSSGAWGSSGTHELRPNDASERGWGRKVIKLTIRPLTPDLWPALEDLFGKRGAANDCWCMYGRIGSAYRNRPAEKNKAEFCDIVRRGPPPGLLAFDGDLVVGWCQVTPRDAVPALDRVWRLKRVDDTPVWSLSCIYVRIGYRKRGITSQLIAAALKVARRAKAPALEAYPFDAELSPSASGCGYASTFAKAGFKTVARRTPARPIMRHDLKAISPRRRDTSRWSG